jgi:hypothetical protein
MPFFPPARLRKLPLRKLPSRLLSALALLLAAQTVAPAAVENAAPAVEPSAHDLTFSKLAPSWDEAVPLGNAHVGALVWQKGANLRFSLDHVALWDLRQKPAMAELDRYNFKWVEKQALTRNYKLVQDRYDTPYGRIPFPTKIPGGALEFDARALGETESVRLYLRNALCEVKWRSGVRLQTFVHASENSGWFRFENAPQNFEPRLDAPPYGERKKGRVANSLQTGTLGTLGYSQGKIVRSGDTLLYHQTGSNGFFYEIAVAWRRDGNALEGVWTIRPKTENATANATVPPLAEQLKKTLQTGFSAAYTAHKKWWQNYWAKATVSIPDAQLAKQYHNEMYKFGAAARKDAPPISLQAVWTADDGKLPPWFGDFHHDLNTQLSYWPCYAGNRLEEGSGYLNWLWDIIPESKKYTRSFFGVDGLNVAGVGTIKGEPMGGWIQYSFGITVSAWLSQHFYLHWLYSRDKDFLKNRAYPYLKEVAIFLDNISVRDAAGKRKLPLSASPEIFNNSRQAWFLTTTNYDLALIRFVFGAADECARELGEFTEADRWRTILSEWPDYDLDSDGALTFAKGFPQTQSHRHLSHIMAMHPLGLIDPANGERDKKIIAATLKKLDKVGSAEWCGYSFSWLGNVKARALDGEGAAKALKIFAGSFCLPNTFHVNGEQTRLGYSSLHYRPFTLEGNFAFASGIHEMLLQSHTGVIRLFPAIPAAWKEASFENLRATGAFLVSAKLAGGKVVSVRVFSEKGGLLRIGKPDGANANTLKLRGGKLLKEENNIWFIETSAGEEVFGSSLL